MSISTKREGRQLKGKTLTLGLLTSASLACTSPVCLAFSSVLNNSGDAGQSSDDSASSDDSGLGKADWSLPFTGHMNVAGTSQTQKQSAGKEHFSVSPAYHVIHCDRPHPAAAAQGIAPSSENQAASAGVRPTAAALAPVASSPAPATQSASTQDHRIPTENQSAQPSSSAATITTTEPHLRGQVVDKDEVISGNVSVWDGPVSVGKIIDHLVDENFENSTEGKRLDKLVAHMRGHPQKAVSLAKDSLNYVLAYQGIDPSVRAGRLVLDKNYKVRNATWAEYERQKYIDNVHSVVVSSMMEIAEGLGMQDTTRGAAIVSSGRDSLVDLVGAEEAKRTVAALANWLHQVHVPDSAFSQTPWTTFERDKKLEDVMRTALVNDDVVKEVTKKLERYANAGVLKQDSSRIIETTLNGIAILAPGYIPSISAGALEVVYKMGTGGSEENKLEKELLFDKRIQSRIKVLSQEANIALDNYRYALVTKNAPLLAFSDEVLGTLTGKSDATKVVDAQVGLPAGTSIVPPLEAPDKSK